MELSVIRAAIVTYLFPLSFSARYTPTPVSPFSCREASVYMLVYSWYVAIFARARGQSKGGVFFADFLCEFYINCWCFHCPWCDVPKAGSPGRLRYLRKFIFDLSAIGLWCVVYLPYDDVQCSMNCVALGCPSFDLTLMTNFICCAFLRRSRGISPHSTWTAAAAVPGMTPHAIRSARFCTV